VNYLPRRLAERLARRPIRSVSSWRLRRGFGEYEDLSLAQDRSAFVAMKSRTGMSAAKLLFLSGTGRATAAFGISVGMLMPSVSLFLRKSS
jgi:hypothetical protein